MKILQRKWGFLGQPAQWTKIAELKTEGQITNAQQMVDHGEYEYRIIEEEK